MEQEKDGRIAGVVGCGYGRELMNRSELLDKARSFGLRGVTRRNKRDLERLLELRTVYREDRAVMKLFGGVRGQRLCKCRVVKWATKGYGRYKQADPHWVAQRFGADL